MNKTNFFMHFKAFYKIMRPTIHFYKVMYKTKTDRFSKKKNNNNNNNYTKKNS